MTRCAASLHGLRALIGAAALVATLAPSALAAAPARASLTDIENDVMCVSCHESLALAQSPQAYAERSYIRTLIAQGMDKPQIERELVAQYGPTVLGRPPASGFNLTVYVLPPAIVLIGLVALALALPRWRRRSLADRDPDRLPDLSEPDARRLEEELSHF